MIDYRRSRKSGWRRHLSDYKVNQKVKEFDSVQLMRTLRDQLSDEMAKMSPQERILYIQRKAAASPLLDLFSHKPEPETPKDSFERTAEVSAQRLRQGDTSDPSFVCVLGRS